MSGGPKPDSSKSHRPGNAAGDGAANGETPRGAPEKLTLSDPGHDAAGDEIERILQDSEDEASAEDAGHDSFLERFPSAATERIKPE